MEDVIPVWCSNENIGNIAKCPNNRRNQPIWRWGSSGYGLCFGLGPCNPAIDSVPSPSARAIPSIGEHHTLEPQKHNLS